MAERRIVIGDVVAGRDRTGGHRVTGIVIGIGYPSGAPGYYTEIPNDQPDCFCIFQVRTDTINPGYPNEYLRSFVECAELVSK